MIEIEAGYMTGSGNHLSMTIHGELFDRQDIPTIDMDDCWAACHAEMQCKGQNGGCPPYSPHFDKIKPSFDKFYAICVEFDMAWAIKYSGWWKGVSAPGLYILVYADRLTMNYTQRLLKMFESEGYYTLGVSNCPGCSPKKCTVLQDAKCAKPKKRRYSVESTGIECDELHWDLFGSVLPWWYKTPEHMPSKMYRYAGVFGKDELFGDIADSILGVAVTNDNYYVEDLPKPYILDTKTFEIPEEKYWCGEKYEVYRIPVERMKK